MKGKKDNWVWKEILSINSLQSSNKWWVSQGFFIVWCWKSLFYYIFFIYKIWI